MSYKRKVRILFLCTGNSCRSQMCEGYANSLGAEVLEARSAGIESHGKNPRAIAAMAEDSVDISEQESTTLSDDMLQWADTVVTVCGHADSSCPVLPAGTQRVHWPLPDPAKATGTEQQVMAQFCQVRDDIKQRILGLIGGIHMHNR